ncbi:hypothetical protein [Nitratidesulfovibrio liaohensis]|uniref:hypothetical protein n=1 Tax=Nitratidesulfovibrio liaohensis TaxID=2604158 RepID=UPI0014205D04|nr:hypothetical protein [Nitratidesulfovibrio liaohensis]NHZ45226.1 hypothetical protein [Nitratidesulfovibrio liaohensis]
MPSYSRTSRQQTLRPRIARPAMSTEAFLRDIVFAKQPKDGRSELRAGAPDVAADISGRMSLPDTAVSGGNLTLPVAGSGFSCCCDFGPDGKLRTKLETCGGHVVEYGYTFDKRGHLSEVRRNGTLAEEYTCNAAGQRIMARTATVPGMSRDARRGLEPDRSFAYDREGRMVHGGVRGTATRPMVPCAAGRRGGNVRISSTATAVSGRYWCVTGCAGMHVASRVSWEGSRGTPHHQGGNSGPLVGMTRSAERAFLAPLQSSVTVRRKNGPSQCGRPFL